MILSEKIKIYIPANKNKTNLLNLFFLMSKELFNARELAWRLFLRDFKVRYKQSLFGWFWVFILPFVAVGTFFILNQSGAIKIENLPVPYPIYGLIGISIWQIFAGGLTNATGSLVSAGSFIVKINFSRETLVLAALGQSIVEFLIRVIMLLAIYVFFGMFPSPWILLLPFFIIPLFLLTLGLSFLSSLLNAVLRDVQTLISVVTGFFLFLMPIMYTMPAKGLLFEINKFNPLFFLIAVPRDIVISGKSNYLSEFVISSFFAVIVFLFGWLVFNKSQSKIAEAV